jgi:hypothetical protein
VEIRDYLRAIAKRKWVVILLPLLTAALGLGYVLSRPASWIGTVTVTAHPASAAAGSVVQYINSFQGAMGSDTIINEVAQQTGLNPSAVSGGLGAQPIGADSLILKVTYTGKNKALAPKVAEQAARDTLYILARPALAEAQASLNAEQIDYQAAKAAMDKYTSLSGFPAPLQSYRADLSTLSQLQVAYQIALLQNQSTAPALKALVTTQQQTVNSLSGAINQWQRLNNVETADGVNVSQANSAVAEARAQLATANDPAAVIPGYTTKASRVSDIIKLVGPLVVAVLVLVIGVIIIRENRRNRANPKTPAV